MLLINDSFSTLLLYRPHHDFFSFTQSQCTLNIFQLSSSNRFVLCKLLYGIRYSSYCAFFVVDIKNTPKAKGVTLKYTYEKKKEYSAEILAKLSDTKNKMIAYPKLYIKTPTKDLINVKGSISGKPGSNIRVVITEDKLFRTPISVKGKWAIGNITTPPPPPRHTNLQCKKFADTDAYLFKLQNFSLLSYCEKYWYIYSKINFCCLNLLIYLTSVE